MTTASDLADELADLIENLEDLTDCAGAKRDDAEWVTITVATVDEILSALRRVEVMEKALAEFDASYAKCPFSPEQRRPADRGAPCPSCRATARESCGKFVGASNVFVIAARQALTGEA